MDAPYLFWLSLESPTYAAAVVFYIYNDKPRFLKDGALLLVHWAKLTSYAEIRDFMPSSFDDCPLNRLAPELMQSILEELPMEDLISFGNLPKGTTHGQRLSSSYVSRICSVRFTFPTTSFASFRSQPASDCPGRQFLTSYSTGAVLFPRIPPRILTSTYPPAAGKT